MKLQLALDEITLDESLKFLKKVQNDIDIIEVGTPFLLKVGLVAIKKLKEKFPEKLILCDAKIMDAGAYETRIACEAGADYITVLGVTDNLTIKGCLTEAHRLNKKVVVDMICINNIKERVQTLETLGIDVIAVHTGADQQAVGRTPLDDLKEIKKHISSNTQIAVAGGINEINLDEYLKYQPDIIIVGAGILKSEKPIKSVKKIKEKLILHTSL